MEIVVEVLIYNGTIKGVSARKSPSDDYILDESDPTVKEYLVELNDYTEKDMAMMSGGIELHDWHNFNNKGRAK
jgi:hypothetical protein